MDPSPPPRPSAGSSAARFPCQAPLAPLPEICGISDRPPSTLPLSPLTVNGRFPISPCIPHLHRLVTSESGGLAGRRREATAAPIGAALIPAPRRLAWRVSASARLRGERGLQDRGAGPVAPVRVQLERAARSQQPRELARAPPACGLCAWALLRRRGDGFRTRARRGGRFLHPPRAASGRRPCTARPRNAAVGRGSEPARR